MGGDCESSYDLALNCLVFGVGLGRGDVVGEFLWVLIWVWSRWKGNAVVMHDGGCKEVA